MINNSPNGSILEIIVVDDGSTLSQYGVKLEEACRLFQYPKVKLLRMKSHAGPTQKGINFYLFLIETLSLPKTILTRNSRRTTALYSRLTAVLFFPISQAPSILIRK